MKIKSGYIIVVLVVTAFLMGCRSTKFVPDNQRLLKKIKLEGAPQELKDVDMHSLVKQKPNDVILGFMKFQLGVYNLAGRDESKGWNRLMHKLGEAPVIYDSTLMDKSRALLKLYLYNRGFFNATVEMNVDSSQTKKAVVTYVMHPGKPYRIKSVAMEYQDSILKLLIEKDTSKTLLRKNKLYDIDIHDNERERIASDLRNRGFYTFSKDDIYFESDSTLGSYEVDDKVVIKKELRSSVLGDTLTSHSRYIIRDVYFLVEKDAQEVGRTKGTQYTDTLEYKDHTIIYSKKLFVKPEILVSSNFIYPGLFYSEANVTKTHSLLSDLKLFRFINIRFEEKPSQISQLIKELDCYITLTPSYRQTISFSSEFTNSSGNVGAGGNIEFTHKNLFKGAEQFKTSIHAMVESQPTKYDAQTFNTYEYGGEAGITTPKFLLPFRLQKMRLKYNPRTSLDLSYSFQQRPDYTRTIVSTTLGYKWRYSKMVTNSLNLLEINLVKIPVIDSTFEASIANSYMEYSYEDHLVTSTGFTSILNQQDVNRRIDFWYARFNIKSSGNFLSLFNSQFTLNEETGSYEIFEIPYSQFIKSDIDIRFNHYFNRVASSVYRAFVGVGYPYGNLNVIPFEERYYSGGANSIRAWHVRSLGPGNYAGDDLQYYNQTADIKLEFNTEYRFKLVSVIEGAFFLDAGNIWSIRKDMAPEGGLFEWNKFYKQFAVGTGLGIRLDWDYFIIRTDFGLKMVDPTQPEGERFLWANQFITPSSWVFNFGLGYPF